MRQLHVSLIALAGLVAGGCGGCGSDPRPASTGPDSAVVKAAPAAPARGPVTMAVATQGTSLEVTLTNAGDQPIRIAARVDAGEIHLDWLRVELAAADGTTRTLHFADDRDESALIEVDLAPGASTSERVDLARWAIRAHNGDPLAPGTYDLRATWDASREPRGAQFVATATATLVVAAPQGGCATRGYIAPAGARVELLAQQAAGGGAIANVGIHNAGTDPVCVWSHIATHEWQSDWLVIQYADGDKYHHFQRVLELDDSRDKSYGVSVLLAPGATAWHAIDVAAWAARARNGAEPLPAGASLWAMAVYDTSKDTEVWAGQQTASFVLRVP
jgi:hypothetical protein